MKIYEDVSAAYLGTLEDVYDNPEYISSPRGFKSYETTDYSFRVLSPKVEYVKTHDNARNKVISSYSQKEFELYESGTNLVEDFAEASPFWNKIVNPDNKTVNSAYGHLIFVNKSCGNPTMEKHLLQQHAISLDPGNPESQESYDALAESFESVRTPWQWARRALTVDKDTRQAIIRFSLPEHQFLGNKDQTCTLHGNFLIRNNKLNLSITMRSNDLMLGLVYDLPWFISLIYTMRDELSTIYPNLEIGHYTHTAHSMHIYDRNVKSVLKMLGRSK